MFSGVEFRYTLLQFGYRHSITISYYVPQDCDYQTLSLQLSICHRDCRTCSRWLLNYRIRRLAEWLNADTCRVWQRMIVWLCEHWISISASREAAEWYWAWTCANRAQFMLYWDVSERQSLPTECCRGSIEKAPHVCQFWNSSVALPLMSLVFHKENRVYLLALTYGRLCYQPQMYHSLVSMTLCSERPTNILDSVYGLKDFESLRHLHGGEISLSIDCS